MTMRATIERVPEGLAKGGYGQDQAVPLVAVPGSVPCRAWSSSRVESVGADKRAVVEDLRAIVPHDADVRRGDRLSIEDRRGRLIFDGPVVVLTRSRKGSTSSSPGNRTLMLERHK